MRDRRKAERGAALLHQFHRCGCKPFAHAVRGHCGIENRLHWRMDVVLQEDASRIRKGNAPAIMTTIRHLCLNLLSVDFE
jgi:predicted transposase YbfD/YdcC